MYYTMHGEAIHPGYAHSSYQTDTPITASIKHNIFISKSHIQKKKAENDFKTRMHSIRMRTAVADPGFSPGGAPTPKIAIIFHIFAENCMKMKEFGPPGGVHVPGTPLGSANVQ